MAGRCRGRARAAALVFCCFLTLYRGSLDSQRIIKVNVRHLHGARWGAHSL